MIQRAIWEKLSSATTYAARIPMLLIGAGRTGKKTLARQFSALFSNVIWLDLETGSDKNIFANGVGFEDILRAIFFLKNKDLRHKRTLIFLHEIQNCPKAINWFGESGKAGLPYHILASSSLKIPELQVLIENPEKTIEVLYLNPFTFEEFLLCMDEDAALQAFQEVPVPVYAYEKLLHFFHLYTLIGGMPEIVTAYTSNKHLNGLRQVYERLLGSMIIRLSRQTKSTKQRELLGNTLQNSFPFAATRIIFNRFGNSPVRTREMGEAFRTLERHMLVGLVYPSTETHLSTSSIKYPVSFSNQSEIKTLHHSVQSIKYDEKRMSRIKVDQLKSPRLQLLDTGLVNYFSGIQKPLFQSHDMNAIFEGQIARQVVGQEILAAESQDGQPALHFWVRDKAQSTAEVDFIIPYNDLLIPVVVRSGEPGRLRSLHQFIDLAPHPFAVRLYAGQLTVQQTQTIRGKKFYLLSLPYFLAGKIKDHLKGFIRFTSG